MLREVQTVGNTKCLTKYDLFGEFGYDFKTPKETHFSRKFQDIKNTEYNYIKFNRSKIQRMLMIDWGLHEKIYTNKKESTLTYRDVTAFWKYGWYERRLILKLFKTYENSSLLWDLQKKNLMVFNFDLKSRASAELMLDSFFNNLTILVSQPTTFFIRRAFSRVFFFDTIVQMPTSI